jgi:glycosyltransferase involved in cell wall biosynthesis
MGMVTEADDRGERRATPADEVPASRILCVINEAWFFRSHFLPWARVAQDSGFRVAVLAAPQDGVAWAEPGIDLHAAGARRGGLVPRGLWTTAGELRDLARSDGGATLVHAFGLHGMAILALARLRGLSTPRVVSITGLGFLATAAPPLQWAARRATGALARLCDGPRTVWLAENDADPLALGLKPALGEGRVVTLAGAGVDLAEFTVRPLPKAPPLRLIFIARLVRSKGLDLAVAALRQARASGVEATLTVVGEADPANPQALTAEDCASLAAEPGVIWLGRREDVPALLADHHLFILPSRGGEGLPRALLEAAAAGRPALVTAVPGCRDFVEDGVTGFVVPPEDPGALAEAIGHAAASDLGAMGNAARAKVEREASLDEVAGRVVEVYRSLLSRAR